MKKTVHSPEAQKQLYTRLRDKRVLEYALYDALNTEPATEAEVEAILAIAPPEFHYFLEGLGARQPDGSIEVHPRIVAGVVGRALKKPRQKGDVV